MTKKTVKKPSYRKAENLIQKFKEVRYAGKTTVQQYIDMLAVGKEKGIEGKARNTTFPIVLLV